VAEKALLDVNSPVWSPVLDRWPKPTYLTTLGLNEISYNEYMLSLSNFDLLPQNPVLFNPGREEFDRQFLQSLIGFEIDFKPGVAIQDRDNLFQFITVVGKMRYQDDLQLTQLQNTRLEQWRTTLDPTILGDLGIQYLLCRVELADPGSKQCPSGIENDQDYQLVTNWNFDSLYEKYYLYKVFSQ